MQTQPYRLECERLADQLPASDADRRKFYKARAPLGDAEFYGAVLTLPAHLEGRLADLTTCLSAKIAPGLRAELETWKDDWRQWKAGSQVAPAIGTEAWRAQLAAMPQKRVTMDDRPIRRPYTQHYPLWHGRCGRSDWNTTKEQRDTQAAMWREMRRTQGNRIALVCWVLVRRAYKAVWAKDVSVDAERAA